MSRGVSYPSLDELVELGRAEIDAWLRDWPAVDPESLIDAVSDLSASLVADVADLEALAKESPWLRSLVGGSPDAAQELGQLSYSGPLTERRIIYVNASWYVLERLRADVEEAATHAPLAGRVRARRTLRAPDPTRALPS